MRSRTRWKRTSPSVRNPVSLAFSREAWRLLGENFARVLAEPDNLEARGGMQLGACFAGLAIENSMLGAAHALANPLTARYGIVHGQAIGLMLPHVIRFNGAEFGAWYRDLLEGTAVANGLPKPESGSDGLADYVARIVATAGCPCDLRNVALSDDKLADWRPKPPNSGPARSIPRRVGEARVAALCTKRPIVTVGCPESASPLSADPRQEMLHDLQ